jgi:hypothetical protein
MTIYLLKSKYLYIFYLSKKIRHLAMKLFSVPNDINCKDLSAKLGCTTIILSSFVKYFNGRDFSIFLKLTKF